MEHLSFPALEAGLEHVRRSPRDEGIVQLIACRPDNSRRQVLEEVVLDCARGVIGDNWLVRGSRHTPAGPPAPAGRAPAPNPGGAPVGGGEGAGGAVGGAKCYVALALTRETPGAGPRLAIGTAVIEVSAKPHVGCWKYEARF